MSEQIEVQVAVVDSNVILDVLTEDPSWFQWSSEQLAAAAGAGGVVINPIVYAEVSLGFDRIEELDAALPPAIGREALPYSAGFLAGRAYQAYRRNGGSRRTPMPDFYIGAHALVAGYRLLTRDARRYRTYFPRLVLLAPN